MSLFTLLTIPTNCATRRKVAGSIPDEANDPYQFPNPYGRTNALGYTQPLKEMSTTSKEIMYLGSKAAAGA
jgi:hypothetical protein